MTLDIDGYPQIRMPIPSGRDIKIVRDRHERFTVWKDNDRLFKQQPKYLTDNEYYFLITMAEKVGSVYVPRNIIRHDIETISMEFIYPHPVLDCDAFMSHYPSVMQDLMDAEIRHGDLTEYSVLAQYNTPVIIDFSESRWMCDKMPSKRREADSIQLLRTMKKLCKKQ